MYREDPAQITTIIVSILFTAIALKFAPSLGKKMGRDPEKMEALDDIISSSFQLIFSAFLIKTQGESVKTTIEYRQVEQALLVEGLTQAQIDELLVRSEILATELGYSTGDLMIFVAFSAFSETVEGYLGSGVGEAFCTIDDLTPAVRDLIGWAKGLPAVSKSPSAVPAPL